jgi:S-DNA-T family DNA segregation ATPase FtsK/SpoIIIE
MAKRVKRSGLSGASEFKQDIVGIFLIALAIFILVSNLSSETGAIGLYFVKNFLKAGVGVGIYALPVFLGLYGLITLIRHEIRELTLRLIGLCLLFLGFIAFMQLESPLYFGKELSIFSGAGGLLGFGMAFSLKASIGELGSYIALVAISIIGTIFLLNLTMASIIKWIWWTVLAMGQGTATFFKWLFTYSPAKPDKKAKLPEKPKGKAIVAGAAQQKLPLDEEVAPKGKVAPEKSPAVVMGEAKNVISEKKPEKPAPEMIPMPKDMSKDDLEAVLLSGKKFGDYVLPSLDLLEEASAKEKAREKELESNTESRKQLLEDTLRNFGVGGQVVACYVGPAVTKYEIQPNPGVKVSRFFNLADDISLSLASGGVRVEGPVQGKTVIGIEVPNQITSIVHIRDGVSRPEFQGNPSKLFMSLGKDISGSPIYGDLSKMPHLLIAGTTGSGKSVCINSLIISILMRARPDEVKFIMIDPKMVELSVYDGIPHLLAPVVTNARKAAATLRIWVLAEMERRYQLFHAEGVRNIQAYNKRFGEEKGNLPNIVVMIDELADLMMIAANDVEASICRIAQMARATGIHLVIATQRPSVDVITGLIKANIPSRIAFAVATQIDSRVILDSGGAEKLLGRGDMLYNPIGAMKPMRLQGCFVSDKEAESVIKFVKTQGKPDYIQELVDIKVETPQVGPGGVMADGGRDPLFGEAAKLIVNSGQASTSYIQRRFSIGYNRAARMMDQLTDAGIVSVPEGENKPRKILVNLEGLKEKGVQ